ncbi:hypothetical protein [Herbaspirillum seropedicae]|uniref:hypothetical protein n=1 Tax=Herbaspirillum seropedicae TaxID=964 RepID=UPI0008639D63|nr:hypothetical protein [Herbaspirillum seropedicae]AON53789.1 hypothetical protein Hsc_1486 [Herbaspirillum seropedicae]
MNPLKIENLPDPDDAQGIFAFAMSFNGYEHYGSHSASMKAAKKRKRATLMDVRNELFASARASRHLQNEGYLAGYRELLPILCALILAGA